MATRGVALIGQFMAINSSTGAEVTGDGPNITPRLVKDGTSASLTTATVTEVDSTNFPGLYSVPISSTESDCDLLVIGGKSATSNVKIIPTFYQMERLPDAAPGESGGVPTTDASNGVKISVGTSTGQINLTSGKTPVTLNTADVTGNLPAAVNSMANDVITAAAIATGAIAEIQSGLSTLDAAAIRAAVGLAAANLDTQLAAIDTAVDTAVTQTQDLPTMVTGDGTAGAKFTTTALSNAPGGGGGALSTEQEYMICLIAGALGILQSNRTFTNSSTVTQTHYVPDINLADSGGRIVSTIVKSGDSQTGTTVIS